MPLNAASSINEMSRFGSVATPVQAGIAVTRYSFLKKLADVAHSEDADRTVNQIAVSGDGGGAGRRSHGSKDEPRQDEGRSGKGLVMKLETESRASQPDLSASKTKVLFPTMPSKDFETARGLRRLLAEQLRGT